MSIIGDGGDNVDGIKGIGGKTVEKIIEEIVQLVGGMNNLYENVVKGHPIFKSDLQSHPNKYINTIVEKELKEKIISNNLKLVSFEVLSRFLDDPVSTEMVDKRKLIEKTINEKQVFELEVMKGALERSRVYLLEGTLDNIYYNGGT